MRAATLGLLWCSTLLISPGWAAGPVFSGTGPAAAAYGAAAGYPVGPRVWPLPQSFMVGAYSHFSEKYPYRVIARAGQPSTLVSAAEELSLQYTYARKNRDLAEYLARNPATGLLIARGDTVLFEHYQYARTDRDRFLSQSMAKTIVGMLVGIAVREGAIHSINQRAAEYEPTLADTEYGNTSIRALLHMASGVAFKEVYDAPGDNQRLTQMLFGPDNPGPVQAVSVFNKREALPETRFHYAGAETEVLGIVLSRAVNMPLTEYLRTRIWQPMGAEADATWTVDTTGHEVAYCCINAVLRDWARFGLMLAHDGAWNGRQVVPREWILDATTVQAPFLRPGKAASEMGYGYQVWLLPGARRQFVLLGIHGQALFVDPAAKLVLVHTAVRMKASADPASAELRALWKALVARYSG